MLAQIDRILQSLPTASIAFNAPSTLKLDQSVVIQLLLSADQQVRDLKRKVTAVGQRIGTRIRIAPVMEARLTGTHFAILAVTRETQAVASKGVTAWKWEVEPKRTGPQRLHLTLTAVIDINGRESVRTIRTFERTLDINVSLSKRLTRFVNNNWQWIFTAILIPLGVWYVQRRSKQQTSAAP